MQHIHNLRDGLNRTVHLVENYDICIYEQRVVLHKDDNVNADTEHDMQNKTTCKRLFAGEPSHAAQKPARKLKSSEVTHTTTPQPSPLLLLA